MKATRLATLAVTTLFAVASAVPYEVWIDPSITGSITWYDPYNAPTATIISGPTEGFDKDGMPILPKRTAFPDAGAEDHAAPHDGVGVGAGDGELPNSNGVPAWTAMPSKPSNGGTPKEFGRPGQA